LQLLVCRCVRLLTRNSPAFCIFAVALIMFPAGFAARAQGQTGRFDATNLREPADLGGMWLVQGGDNPAYARPDFDDSRWMPFDPHTSITALFPKGHPEVVWYRQRIKVSPSETGLALREQSISHAFEIYVNGERVMVSGQVAPYVAYTTGARVLRQIPDRLLSGGYLVIALRVRMSTIDWAGQDPGFYATNLTLGHEGTLYRDDWLAVIGENALNWLDAALLVGVGFVALVLFAAQRGQSEYLWIFVLGMSRLLDIPIPTIKLFYNIPIGWDFLSSPMYIASPFVTVAMYFAFVQQKIPRKFGIFLVFAGFLNAYSSQSEYLPWLPGSYQLLNNLPFVVILSVVIPVMLAIHLRRGNREAGILLIPAILFSLYVYVNYALVLLFYILPNWRDTALKGLNLIQRYPIGPFSISLGKLSEILSTVSLALIILLRSSTMSRRQALLESELAAAQQVQQLLLPEDTGDVPGFAIESVYQPAQQVGGDFFQIVPTSDGGLLLVVGDVAGKGLPAAMLVSLLVGAIRTAAEETHAPEILLHKLNERLVGRSGGGFSTAIAAHIAGDGTVTIANAGHLSPYLDGHEVVLPGALPLGVVSGSAYETTQFLLNAGSRLTFYSDGVVEAQNEDGELFGFERGLELSTRRAEEIAEAAKRFGQSDDITVVAVTRLETIANAA